MMKLSALQNKAKQLWHKNEEKGEQAFKIVHALAQFKEAMEDAEIHGLLKDYDDSMMLLSLIIKQVDIKDNVEEKI